MDTIIRSAAVSREPRPLRRASSAAVPAPAAATPLAPVAVIAAVAAAPAAPAQQAAEHAHRQALLRLQEEHAVALEELHEQQRQLQRARRQLDEDAAGVLADAERRGHALGQEKGAAEAHAMVATQVERLAHLVATLTQARRQLLDEAEDMLVEIAFAAACRIVGPALGTRQGAVAMVRGLLQQTREPEQLTVRVHPDDLPLFRGAEPALAAGLSLQGDAGIKLGGCMIDSPRGTLDARLELQVQQLAAALQQARRERGNDEAGL